MKPPTHHDMLSAYLDGELESADAARLEAELRTNAALRAELEELRAVQAFLRAHGPVRAPAGFQARILQAIEEEPAARPWWTQPSAQQPLPSAPDASESEAPTRARRPLGVRLEGIAIVAAAALALLFALPDRAPAPVDGSMAADRSAEADPTAHASPTRPESASRSEQRHAPEQVARDPDRPAASQVAATGGAGSRAASAAPSTRTVEVAGGEDQAEPAARPLGRSPGYSYILDTTDPAVLAHLQTLAARHAGAVFDTMGRAVSATHQPSQEATYAIRVPASALPSLHRELTALGVVAREADNRIFASARVEIRVTVRLDGSEAALGAQESPSSQGDLGR